MLGGLLLSNMVKLSPSQHGRKPGFFVFDFQVRNVANFTRLQEECGVMSLVLAKYKGILASKGPPGHVRGTWPGGGG